MQEKGTRNMRSSPKTDVRKFLFCYSCVYV